MAVYSAKLITDYRCISSIWNSKVILIGKKTCNDFKSSEFYNGTHDNLTMVDMAIYKKLKCSNNLFYKSMGIARQIMLNMCLDHKMHFIKQRILC